MASVDHAGLQEAIAGFVAVSSRLERSYRDLQSDIAELNLTRAREQQALDESLSEQALLSRRMEQIFSSVPVGLLLTDLQGRVLHANPEAARLFALSAARIPGSASLPDAIQLLVAQTFSSEPHQGNADERTLEIVSSEGRHWIDMRRTLLATEGDLPSRTAATWLVSLQDVTARVRGERERERAADAVALAEVSALLAHEIRNPLASMELFADLLEEMPERNEEWRFHLRAGIRTLSATVNNVLLLSGTAAPPTERLDLVAELQPILRFLGPLARQAEVHLFPETPSGPVWACADRTSLHQLLINLCTNAFRHTPPKGEVCVTCRLSPSGTPVLSVADTGDGIPAEQLANLLTPGGAGSRHRTGLGLTVCDRLMRQQGGRLRISSTVGVGSTFTLEFQAA